MATTSNSFVIVEKDGEGIYGSALEPMELLDAMNALGCRFGEVARRSGLGMHALRCIASGVRRAGHEETLRIAEALGCNAAVICSWPTTGRELRAWRKSKGLTQRAVANEIGVSQGHISGFECGHRALGHDKAEKIRLLIAG